MPTMWMEVPTQSSPLLQSTTFPFDRICCSHQVTVWLQVEKVWGLLQIPCSLFPVTITPGILLLQEEIEEIRFYLLLWLTLYTPEDVQFMRQMHTRPQTDRREKSLHIITKIASLIQH